LKHDLHSLFTEGKSLTSLITDGLYIFAHIKTNSSEVLKTGLYEFAEKAHLKKLKSLFALFLQKNFHFDVTLPEVNVADFLSGDIQQMAGMTTSMALPMIQGGAGSITPMLENPPVPTLATLTDLGKTNLKCNFSLSFKVAEAILTFHFKTSGIKELLGF